jgi:hypothetical protein
MVLLIILCSPVFVVANVLVLSSPPALTLAQVCILSGVVQLRLKCVVFTDHTGRFG